MLKFFLQFILLGCSSGVLIGSPVTPEMILPDGADSNICVNPYTGKSCPARKGTVAATINNVVILNELLKSGDVDKIKEIEDSIKELLSSLDAIGLFDFFSLSEWIGNEEQPGRVLIAVLYLKSNPEKMTPELQKQLKELRNVPSYLKEQISAL